MVLLDFWTAGCVNCRHALGEVRALEQQFGDELVVIGVHTPKFPHEAEPGFVADAAARLGIEHPVLDDAGHENWDQYAVRAWPTLVVVDPAGYVVHTAVGEGHGAELADVVARLLGHPPPQPVAQRDPAPSLPGLRFPTGLLALPDGDLLVCDTGHHQLVRLDRDLRERQRYGTGERGWRDGPQPQFAEPHGLCLAGDAEDAPGAVVVADTGNSCLRRLELATGAAATVAGTGRRWQPGDASSGNALEVPLSSPHDVVTHDGALVIAMTGRHQLGELRDGRLRVLAGTGAEELRDGAAERAYLAQPSALASDGRRVWFVDAETSALRWYVDGVVSTAVGTGLFGYGDADGSARAALLQHPLGVAVLDDGGVAVADTYNGAVRRYDPQRDVVETLARGLREPVGLASVDSRVLVVERAAHRITQLDAVCHP